MNAPAIHLKKFRTSINKSARELSKSSPQLAEWIGQCGPCNLEVAWERNLYEALVRAVAHQQLHARAAETILGRLQAGFRGDGFPAPEKLARASVDKLRACGFSTSKVTAIQGIARAELNGSIPDRTRASSFTDDQLIQILTELRGVGRWTVEMLLIFTLGRLDVMPIDDFGVRHGMQQLLKLRDMPSKKQLEEFTLDWAPHRTVAAWYLWRRADQARADQKALSKSKSECGAQ